MLAPAIIDALPEHLTQRGGSPDLVKAEYLDVIAQAINNHPRSLQKRVGPSELGSPCARRIGYKLADVDEVNAFGDPAWLPTIGTSVHSWLEDKFTQANAGLGSARWLTELRVSVGEVGGVEITGSLDLYDRVTATLIDHKIVGVGPLREYRSKGAGPQYRGQLHLYGRGLVRRGLPVDRVMIAFLPRSGELRDAHFWSEPYDEQIALDVLQRAEGIDIAVKMLGVEALPTLPTADQFCRRCPWYRHNSTDPRTACAGDPASQRPTTPALTLG